MGNTIGGRRKAKVMKIDGETIKLKTPIQASEVVKDYPGYVLLDSEAVKHFGIRAKPLEPRQQLKPKKVYFLVELPKLPDEEKITRRVRSGIQMSAKDRLECLMLSRRAVSDLTAVNVRSSHGSEVAPGPGTGQMRVKMRLPRAQVEKLMEESANDGEVAEKIVDLYVEKSGGGGGRCYSGELRPEEEWKAGQGGVRRDFKARENKRVSFVPSEGEIHLNVASQ
ncbi:hypothetical protein KPL71_019014 [Citrus sinensis]|uniref:Uncharacterized protein n=1 Tax=Citrus sinensis TaxID=2711 RepID=A0ACB8K543_CITSI|nr:hypothetical protein KPL71_019014 [Citrus sinensis]